MANVSISEASRLSGKGRATIQRHIKSGKLSVGKNETGAQVIDTAELMRVYGSIQIKDTGETAPVIQDDTGIIETLQAELKAAREREKLAQEREEWLKAQLEAEQERSKELIQRMLPPGPNSDAAVEAPKGFFKRIFGA